MKKIPSRPALRREKTSGRGFGLQFAPGLSLAIWVSLIPSAQPASPVASHAPAASHSVAAPSPADITGTRAVLDKYCVTCHSQKLKTAGLSLEGLDIAHIADHAEIGEKVVLKLRAGMMPPSGLPRPDAATYSKVAGTLERQLDLAEAAKPQFPAPGVHRLNRTEYANDVRDLLALEIDPAAVLPVDDSSYGFDNMAGTLGSSPALVDSYVSAAAKISRLALGHEMGTTQKVYPSPPDNSQNRHVEGLPFGTRGGLLVHHYFPVDGVYAFDWKPVRSNAGGVFGVTAGEKLELSVDGKQVKVWDADKDVPRAGGTNADHHEVRVPVKAGLRTIELGFITTTDMPSNDLNRHFERTTLTQDIPGFTFAIHVNSMSITGPFDGKRPDHTASRDRIFICRPATQAEEVGCARKILTTLAARAYRRPATDRDAEMLLSQYQQGRNAGDFETGIERGLQLILTDPEFVYRTEPVPVGVKPGQAYPVSDLDLAARLSFFLWSSAPDDELLKLATQGKLHETAVLEQQTRRMLGDPKSKALVDNFAGQWLQLRNLSASSPVADLFPDFDDNLRQAFKTETELFFESIMQEDRNVVDLLNADYTFVNERLAKHYGIPDVYGSQFRRVHLGPEFDMRRGLLGQGSIQMVSSSVADRTSPTKRGKWVLMNVLGVVPPDPPPNVPPFPAGESGKVTTIRERMEMHRKNPACASCHKMMDPLGFAMENFDAIGRYRTADSGIPLDLTGQLVDGSKFAGTAELRSQLLHYSPQFVNTMTQRLLSYALGRGLDYYDMSTVRQIDKEAAAQNNRFSVLVLGVVRSQPFRMNQAAGEVVARK